jgi:hypothetical protein
VRYSLEKPKPLHLLTCEATRCHWCTGLLKRLRNIYKGQNCERYYCSQKCLKDGKERAAQYAKRPVKPSARHAQLAVNMAGAAAPGVAGLGAARRPRSTWSWATTRPTTRRS